MLVVYILRGYPVYGLLEVAYSPALKFKSSGNIIHFLKNAQNRRYLPRNWAC